MFESYKTCNMRKSATSSNSQPCRGGTNIGAKRSGRLLTRARKRLWLSGLGGTAAEPSSPRVSVTRWEKGRSKRGVNPTHMISWHTPLTPLSEVAKAITGEQGIKKVIKLLLRAGCGTRPSREGRAEGGVGYKGPLIFIRAATRLPGALFDRRPQPGARLWLQLRDPPPIQLRQ